MQSEGVAVVHGVPVVNAVGVLPAELDRDRAASGYAGHPYVDMPVQHDHAVDAVVVRGYVDQLVLRIEARFPGQGDEQAREREAVAASLDECLPGRQVRVCVVAARHVTDFAHPLEQSPEAPGLVGNFLEVRNELAHVLVGGDDIDVGMLGTRDRFAQDRLARKQVGIGNAVVGEIYGRLTPRSRKEHPNHPADVTGPPHSIPQSAKGDVLTERPF